MPVKALTLLDPPYAFYNLPILGELRVLKSVLTPKQKTVRFATTPLATRIYKPQSTVRTSVATLLEKHVQKPQSILKTSKY